MKKLFVIPAVALAFTLVSPLATFAADSSNTKATAKDASLEEFKKAIRSMYDLKVKAFANRDADTIVDQFYSPDAIATGEGQEVMMGREELRPLYKKVVQEYDVEVESVSTYVNGNAGWDWTNFTLKPRNMKDKPFTVKMLFIWEKKDGKWWSKGDIFAVGNMKKLK